MIDRRASLPHTLSAFLHICPELACLRVVADRLLLSKRVLHRIDQFKESSWLTTTQTRCSI